MVVERGSFMIQDTFVEKYYEDLVLTAVPKACAFNATQEEWALVTELNTALALLSKDALPTTKRLKLTGVLNVIQGAASADLVNWSSGDLADGDARQRAYTTPAAAATYPQEVVFHTDETGNVNIKVALIANVTFTFVLESVSEVQTLEE